MNMGLFVSNQRLPMRENGFYAPGKHMNHSLTQEPESHDLHKPHEDVKATIKGGSGHQVSRRRSGLLLVFLMVALALVSITFFGQFEIDSFRIENDDENQFIEILKSIRQASLLDNIQSLDNGRGTVDPATRDAAKDYVVHLASRGLFLTFDPSVKSPLDYFPADPGFSVARFGPNNSYYWLLTENFCVDPSFENGNFTTSWSHSFSSTVTLVSDFPGKNRLLKDELLPNSNIYGKPYQPGRGSCIELTR